MTLDKREQLLDTALHLFVEKGFQSTSTALITRTAGVATGTLFHYFQSKEELINELYIINKQSFAKDLASGLSLEKTDEAKLKKIWKNGISWGMHYPDKYKFLQQFSHSPFITAYTREQVFKEFKFMIDTFYAVIKKSDLAGLSEDFVGSWFGTQILQAIGQFISFPEQYSEENAEKLFDLTWSGLKS